MVPPNLACRLSIAEDHSYRAFPDPVTRAHALPPSILPEIDHAAAVRICRLLPPRLFQVLTIDGLIMGGSLPGPILREQEPDRFYEYLVTYEGDEPELVL